MENKNLCATCANNIKNECIVTAIFEPLMIGNSRMVINCDQYRERIFILDGEYFLKQSHNDIYRRSIVIKDSRVVEAKIQYP